MIFGDQPDYTVDLSPPSLGDIARATIHRYLAGDLPQTDAEREHEERDPEGWRRLSIQRTRWRIERHHEAQYAEMVADREREALGWPALRAPEPFGLWTGPGDAPWSEVY